MLPRTLIAFAADCERTASLNPFSGGVRKQAPQATILTTYRHFQGQNRWIAQQLAATDRTGNDSNDTIIVNEVASDRVSSLQRDPILAERIGTFEGYLE